MERKKLTKNAIDRKLFGVCSGIADYLDVDPTIIRLIWLFSICIFGTGLLAYLVAALVMPEDPRVIR